MAVAEPRHGGLGWNAAGGFLDLLDWRWVAMVFWGTLA